MTERRLDSMQEAADHLLDTLESGREVTLEITAQDTETEGLLRLITEIHGVAVDRRISISIMPVGERGIRLTLVGVSAA